MLESERRKAILEGLAQAYPDAKCALNYSNPFELLIATILAAQCTDKLVNQVTPGLFSRYRKPEDFLHLTQEELEEKIRQVGLYKNKAKNILATCRKLVEQYNSQVPSTLEELTELPGVGRKTANVVLSNAFSIPAIAVDTHVFRVSNRLGLAQSKDVLGTEKDLMEHIPRDHWSAAHHWLIHHGRQICHARRPRCEICSLNSLCITFTSGK